MQAWDEVHDFLLDEALRDLEATGEVRPCLVAFAGDDPLFLAWLRPFEKGGYHQPMIEVLALSCPLGGDRLALSLAGRAWSQLDPVPPVIEGVGDLRQRVVLIESVDATSTPPQRASLIAPFTPEGRTVRWSPERTELDGATGWASNALLQAAARHTELAETDDAIRDQALRCVSLGHLVAFEPAVVDRLGLHRFATPSA